MHLRRGLCGQLHLENAAEVALNQLIDRYYTEIENQDEIA